MNIRILKKRESGFYALTVKSLKASSAEITCLFTEVIYPDVNNDYVSISDDKTILIELWDKAAIEFKKQWKAIKAEEAGELDIPITTIGQKI